MPNLNLENIYTYHPPTQETLPKFEQLRSKAKEFACLIQEICPDSRERAAGLTNLENALFWVNASVARNQ
jgi:hypothetical protein